MIESNAPPAVDDCWFAMVVALVDIWRDGNYNAPDERTYVPGALKDVMLEAEKMLKAHRTRIAASGNHADARSDETTTSPEPKERSTALTEQIEALLARLATLSPGFADELRAALSHRSTEAPTRCHWSGAGMMPHPEGAWVPHRTGLGIESPPPEGEPK